MYCGNPKNGFAPIRCGDGRSEFLLNFSCRNHRFCPSCYDKSIDKWGEWMREKITFGCASLPPQDV
ncbi:MAG: transposase zinc-binding domain-containing protein [Candidatus Aminicenantaceae bacterium]